MRENWVDVFVTGWRSYSQSLDSNGGELDGQNAREITASARKGPTEALLSAAYTHALSLPKPHPNRGPQGKRERSSFTHVFPSFSIDDQDSSPMPNSVPDLTAIRLPTSTPSQRNGSFATLTCLLHSTSQMQNSGSSSNGDSSAASAEEPGWSSGDS
jgi:hypothetical protein